MLDGKVNDFGIGIARGIFGGRGVIGLDLSLGLIFGLIR